MSYPIGRGQKSETRYSDIELTYANKGFVIDIYHIPSGKNVVFKAMLTNFEDRYESNWNHEEVYGRNDPISNFRNTRRTISLAWDVVAASIGEAKDNLQKIGLLNSMLYPSYDTFGNVSSISASPLFRISFTNLIRNYGNSTKIRPVAGQSGGIGISNSGGLAKEAGLVGAINGLTYAPVINDGFFDPPDELGNIFPQTVNLSFDFVVFHLHSVGWFNKEFNTNAGSYPYGRPNISSEGENTNNVMNETKRGGTDKHNTAQQRNITNR